MASSGICMVCGSMGMGAGGDGFFYCITCGSQSQTLQEQDLDDFEDARMLHVREANVSRKLEQDAAIIAFQQQGAVAGGHADPLLASAFSSQAEQETLLRIISQNSTQVASAEEELRNRIAVASQYGGTAGVQFWSLSQTDEPAVVLQRMGNQFRETYVRGVQRILQMQCEALVEQFGVSPLICGIAGPIWLRFLASTHVFEKEWADEAIQLAEVKKITKQDEHCGDADPDIRTPKSTYKPDVQTDRKKFLRKSSFKEPMTSNGLRITSVWLAAIKERIPLTVTLAISFLACHIAREPVLPTDITKWALEGVLPYLAAFLKVDVKFNDGQYAPPDLLLSNLDSKRMFKPMRMISARMVEFLAAHIAVRVGLELPPVNFYALSCRFLKELDLPVEKLATYVCRLYEWYCPSNLWLEAREDAFPSRVFVMAMILITIKILYKLDGGNISGQSFNSQLETQKKDEAYFRLFHDNSNLESRPTKDAEMMQFRNQDQAKDKGAIGDADTQHREKNIPDIEEWNAKELIGNLERSLLRSNSPSFDYQKDLPTYLRYCKDIIFSGAILSADEELAYGHFWKLYEKTSNQDPNELVSKTQANGVIDSSKSQRQKRVQNAEVGASIKLESPAVSLNSASSSYCDKKGLLAIKAQKSDKKSKSVELLSEKNVRTKTRKENLSESLVIDKEEKNRPANKRIQDLLIEEMEGSGFHYLPPTSGISEPDRYLFYIHKRMKGRFDRFVHGDYFIVLFACAKVVQVDPKVLHRCVRQLERQLKGVENRVHSLKQYIYTSHVLEKEMATDVG